jgi:hypothetical protein
MPALLDDYRPYIPPASGLTQGINPYASWIQRYLASDPVKAAQFLGINTNVANQLAGYQAQGDQEWINYGMIPEGVNVSNAVRLAAEDATKAGYSTWAQLANAYHDQRSASIGGLGARGLVRSSAYGTGKNIDARNYGVATTNAVNKVNAALYGLQQQGLQAQQTGIGQKVTAEQNSLDNLYEMIRNGMISLPPTGVGGAGGAGGAAPMKPYPAPSGYNPYGYVPGGSSPAVSSAITARALKGPLFGPSYNPQAYVSGSRSPNTGTVIQQRGAAPQAYPTGLPSPNPSVLTPRGQAPYG